MMSGDKLDVIFLYVCVCVHACVCVWINCNVCGQAFGDVYPRCVCVTWAILQCLIVSILW